MSGGAMNAILKYPGAKWSLAVKNRRAILLALRPPQAAPREWIIGHFPSHHSRRKEVL